MKRVRVIMLFLLLGAIVNVAVAWGCALWSVLAPLSVPPKNSTVLRARVDPDFEVIHRRAGIGLDITVVTGGQVIETGMSGSATVYEAELPWRAMTEWRGALTDHQVFVRAPDWMYPIQSMFDRRFLPPRPLWLGFAANTVLLALVLWSPFVPWVLRQYLRCKRGLCVKCAYDLRGAEHEVCPECGTQ